VPVRILLDAQDLQAHPLRIGLSMSVQVDVASTTGEPVAQATRNTPQLRQASDGDDPKIDARIHQIIADNSGSARHRAP